MEKEKETLGGGCVMESRGKVRKYGATGGGREVRDPQPACGRGVGGLLGEVRGQGTTEYAILVGVLVVIAILAIIAFRGKVQQLWDAIVSGMNAL